MRYVFNSIGQSETENIEEFIMDLKLKSQSCSFGQLTRWYDDDMKGDRGKRLKEEWLGEADLTLKNGDTDMSSQRSNQAAHTVNAQCCCSQKHMQTSS